MNCTMRFLFNNKTPEMYATCISPTKSSKVSDMGQKVVSMVFHWLVACLGLSTWRPWKANLNSGALLKTAALSNIAASPRGYLGFPKPFWPASVYCIESMPVVTFQYFQTVFPRIFVQNHSVDCESKIKIGRAHV